MIAHDNDDDDEEEEEEKDKEEDDEEGNWKLTSLATRSNEKIILSCYTTFMS